MSGGGQTSTSTQSQQPPAYLIPSLQYGVNQAQQLYQSSSPSYYPGSTVAAQSPYTQAANQGAAALAMGGNPATNAAQQYAQGVLGGKYTGAAGANPYLNQIDTAMWNQVAPQVESQFSLGGRYGSPSMGGELAQGFSNAIAPYHYGDYEAERQNQQQAMQMAPQFAQQQQSQLQQLGQVGSQQDAYNQSQVNAPINQWNYNQNLMANKLAQYMSLISGGQFGTQGTSTTTQPGGGLTGFLGGLLGGIL